MKHPPRKSEQAIIKFFNTHSLSRFVLGSIIKIDSKLVADRIFVPSAAQKNMKKQQLLTCRILVTYKNINR